MANRKSQVLVTPFNDLTHGAARLRVQVEEQLVTISESRDREPSRAPVDVPNALGGVDLRKAKSRVGQSATHETMLFKRVADGQERHVLAHPVDERGEAKPIVNA